MSRLFAVLMMVQATSGLLFPSAYRDPDWIRVAWFGNDCATIGVAWALLFTSWRAAQSERAWVLWLGCLAYGVYNYCYYLFGAALNVFLPLYVVLLLMALALLARALLQPSHLPSAQRFQPRVSERVPAGYLLLLALSLTGVWVSMWASYVFWARPTPIEPGAFKVVFAVDTVVLVPTFAIGGALLWRRSDWGYVVAGLGSVLGSLYLLLLLGNSALVIRAGLAESPGEVPIWGTLAGLTLAATVAILSGVPARLERR